MPFPLTPLGLINTRLISRTATSSSRCLSLPPPIGGGEGALRGDRGILVIDKISDGADVPARHGTSWYFLTLSGQFCKQKKKLGGEEFGKRPTSIAPHRVIDQAGIPVPVFPPPLSDPQELSSVGIENRDLLAQEVAFCKPGSVIKRALLLVREKRGGYAPDKKLDGHGKEHEAHDPNGDRGAGFPQIPKNSPGSGPG